MFVQIGMHIRSIRFLDDGTPDVMFSQGRRIQEGSVPLLLKEFVQC